MTCCEPGDDFHPIVVLGPQLDHARLELALAASEKDHVLVARANHRVGGNAQPLLGGRLQRDLAASLEERMEHVSVERLVSGPGLKRIYEFLVERGVSSWPEVRESFAWEDPSAVISRFALTHRDLACEQALDLFFELYGAEAGNLALRVLPTGGVFVVGGIAVKNLEKLNDGTLKTGW